MTATTIALGPMSEAEHQSALRRAVIASTVGTTIEWYDFLIYSTVTGLVFDKVYFPGSDPLDRHAAGVRRVLHRLRRAADRRRDLRPLRRPHRPQGDPDRHPADDRHRDRRGRAGAGLRHRSASGARSSSPCCA